MAVRLLQQAAVDAWRELRHGVEPHLIDELQVPGKGKKTAVYRLGGVGADGTAVIAKRARKDRAEIERTVYEEVLPRLPIPSLRYYGVVADDDHDRMWIFVEDAGDGRYCASRHDHRVMAAGWLGLMHNTVASLQLRPQLPKREPEYYRQELRSTHQGILENIDNPSLSVDDVSVLRAILAQFESIDARWQDIEERCRRLPLTVVHGDFAERNLRCRDNGQGASLMPFDWETANWGSPAVDLAQFIADSEDAPLRSYLHGVQPAWPDVGEQDIRCIASVGTVFRAIMSIRAEHYGLIYDRWVGRGVDFAHDYARWTMTELRSHREWLARAADALRSDFKGI